MLLAEVDISATPHMRIGVMSGKTGCIVETIRYYEHIGLMPDPRASGRGQRLYHRGHLKRLTFIRRARQLGFSLAEVRLLLGLVDSNEYTCEEIRDLTAEQLQKVRCRLADLTKLEHVLADMVSQCESRVKPQCPIIDALFDAPA